MVFLRQSWTLCQKTLTIVFFRHWLGTIIRAFLAPVIFIFFISYAKNFFVPPSNFGIATSPKPLQSFGEALDKSTRGKVVFVNNGFTSGAISHVIDELSSTARDHGKVVQILTSDYQLLDACKSSIRGVSDCYGAVSFHSSPTQGAGSWNYTLRFDGDLGGRIYVNSDNNDAQVYVLPFQHAVDSLIASSAGVTLTDNVQQYPYTSQTPVQRNRRINHLYMGSIIHVLAVAYFIGVVGVCYQLTGEMAKEREIGMAQLIEAMMPNTKRWMPQAARLLSIHVAFDILYIPSWVVMGLTVAGLNYTLSNAGILVAYFIVAGLALSSWSIAAASLFRRAQLSGISVVMASIILGIIVQVVPPQSTGAAIILSLIFPPINFVLFIITAAYWQQAHLALDLQMNAPNAPWQFPGYVFFIFLVIQILAYPLLGAVIERSLYGTASKARRLRYDQVESAETIKIMGLSKHYRPNWWARKVSTVFSKKPISTVLAVNNVDLTVLRGQIMVLLGSNGSGKTTTLDMLAGLQTPSGGEIEIEAAGGIGLCPQRNVLWDELTVLEHVKIFNRLKSAKPDQSSGIKDLIRACDLEQKTNHCSRTLSGGQKRKCQLAMMLTGGSRVCVVDEVSSGLDPVSRRKIWDILLAERGRRSILLTTHYLDEADLLSDDITIMSKGNVVAHGTSVELKHHYGRGYRVGIYNENIRQLPSDLQSTPKQILRDQVIYQLADSSAATQFVGRLEAAGVRDYQVNGPSIEDVFLKVAVESGDGPITDQAEDESDGKKGDVHLTSQEVPAGENTLQLTSGKEISAFAQMRVLFKKRWTIIKRNRWPYAAALLIPIIAAGLVTLFIKGFTAISCQPSALASNETIYSLNGIFALDSNVPLGPPSSIPTKLLRKQFPNLGYLGAFEPVKTFGGFQKYIEANYSIVQPGGFYQDSSTTTLAWQGDYGLQFAMATQNLMDVSLTKIPITTQYQPFSSLWSPDTGSTLLFIFYFGLAMSVYPAFFSLYTTVERLRNVRALHYSNGVRAAPLWFAYTLFDFIIVLLVAAISIIIFTSLSNVWYGPGQLFVVFVFYGLSATLMSYLVSLVTTSQLAAFAVSAGVQCSMFLLAFIAYMCIITYDNPGRVATDVNIANFAIAIFFPSANLLRAMLLTFNEFSLLCRGHEIASNPGGITTFGGPILYCIIQCIVFWLVLVWVDSGWQPPFLARQKRRLPDAEETEEVDREVFDEARRANKSSDELRVLHLTKVFGSNVAVSDISFGVRKGSTLALLGPNGGGKSTTASLIRGDIRPSNRDSQILIENISVFRNRAAARKNLGVCPQFDAIDQMTAEEHLRFYARVRGVENVEHNIDQVMNAVGLAPFRSRMASTLSGGNKRKLSLAIALMGNPSVLILDEPSSGLDALSKRRLWKTLRSVAYDRSMVLTTHAMEEAAALADRAAILARRMLAIGRADELRKKHSDSYFGHIVHKDAPKTSMDDMERIKQFICQTFPGAVTEERPFHGQLRFSVPNSSYPKHDSISINSDEKSKHWDDSEKVTPNTPVGVDAINGQPSSGISALFSNLEANKERLGFEFYSISQATLDQVFLAIVTKHNVIEENYVREHQAKEGWWMRLKHKLGGETWTVLFKF